MKTKVIGDSVSNAKGRSDEGTPIALSDFHGRALVVFFIGDSFERTSMTLIKNIKRRVEEFFEFSCSPIVVSLKDFEVLGSLRETEELPFITISDISGLIHKQMVGKLPLTSGSPGSFVIDEEGLICATIPVMPPREQVSATIAAISRIVVTEK